MMTSPSVERMDDIDYKQETESFEYKVMETEQVVTVDYGPDWSEDWALGDGIWFGMRWIGTTMRDEWHRSWMGTSLVTVEKPIGEEPEPKNASRHEDWQVCPAEVVDWPLDFEMFNPGRVQKELNGVGQPGIGTLTMPLKSTMAGTST